MADGRTADDKTADNHDAKRRLLDTYFAEYNSLRSEQLSRLGSQNQAFNYLLIVMGAGITAVISAFDKSQQLALTIVVVTLLLPVISAPLGFIFFDNEMAIHSIGAYIFWYWRPNIIALVKEDKIFENSLEFRRLHKSSRKIHQRLSAARWVLFLVPTVLPAIGMFIYTLTNWGWWRSYLLNLTQAQSKIIIMICVIVFCMDILLSSLLLQAIIWTFRKHKI